MRQQESVIAATVFPHLVARHARRFTVRDEATPLAVAEYARISKLPARNSAVVRMTCMDRAIINIYFHRFYGDTGSVRPRNPGLRRRLCVQWLRGWRLPRKLHAELLPAELQRKLSALGPEYQRVMVNCDVMLIEAATRRVVDVMQVTTVPAVGGEWLHISAQRAAA